MSKADPIQRAALFLANNFSRFERRLRLKYTRRVLVLALLVAASLLFIPEQLTGEQTAAVFFWLVLFIVFVASQAMHLSRATRQADELGVALRTGRLQRHYVWGEKRKEVAREEPERRSAEEESEGEPE